MDSPDRPQAERNNSLVKDTILGLKPQIKIKRVVVKNSIQK
jgi:hypothetical protein